MKFLLGKLKNAARLCRRVLHFLLPPALYDAPRAWTPRALQPGNRQKLARRILKKLPALVARIVKNRLAGRGLLPSAADFAARYREAYALPERSSADLKRKADAYRAMLNARLDRARIAREIARLERALGNDLTAALHAIRSMRWLGDDIAGDLPWAKATLEKHGYQYEAAAIDAMFGPHPDRFERCRRLFDAATERCRTTVSPCEFARYDDARGNIRPRVAVIVSLYNAADKLSTFLSALRTQTLLSRDQLEVIFVDSASPADEYRALKEDVGASAIPYLFVRTPERESIQTAWNRGIALARAPYLAFLGVDESVLPTAYEELAAELDAHADVDWVMADSLVMDVDANGTPVRDVMPYDRSGYHQDLVYLETCYLSWVGGLYRKSIHERFGYYDGSFRAAGDTEFKCRVMPFIRSRHLPKLLGLFLNYPEERTTASPRAELEDLRAWNLHRTAAGVAYAFADRDSEELEAMLVRSLNYRKSYCRHRSTDDEYACSVAEVLRRRFPESSVLALADGATRMRAAYRSLDSLPGTTRAAVKKSLKNALAELRAVRRAHRRTPWLADVEYVLFRDNLHEQHTHPW